MTTAQKTRSLLKVPGRLVLVWCALGVQLAGGQSVPPAAASADRPNILFIMTDQQCAEAMSCRMGQRYLHTPAMDSLAGQGVSFTRAYCANPLCLPSRNSIFTGRYPHETGVMNNNTPNACLDPKAFACMGTFFRNAGYEAAYSGKWHLCFKPEDREAHGFEILKGKGGGGYDQAVTAGALAFLARPHDKPFLLVASFLNPHNVCELARRVAGRKAVMTCGEIGAPPSVEQLPPLPANFAPPKNEPDGMVLMRQAYQVETGPFPVGKYSETDWRQLRWGYDRMVELVDQEIGRLLAALRQAGLEDNTLIVFTSDHGECVGAHGWNQKTVFYEEAARVPLIVSWKGRTKPGVCDKLVNIGIDILPTLLRAAGLAAPESLPGHSTLALALGEPVSNWPDHVVVENDLAQAGKLNGFYPRLSGRMVRSERYKYCLYSRGQRRESLVDLQADPGERTDLAADPAYRQVLVEHRALLARFGRAYHDTLVAEMLADEVKPVGFQAATKPVARTVGERPPRHGNKNPNSP